MNVGRRSVPNLTRALALLLCLTGPLAGCGRKQKAAKHGVDESPAPAPTPDNTPVPALRTPAGLVLKLEESGPATPTPPATPAATPSPNPTP
jgi:hypothetical protein